MLYRLFRKSRTYNKMVRWSVARHPIEEPFLRQETWEEDPGRLQNTAVTWFLSSPFIIRVPFFLLFGFGKGALK